VNAGANRLELCGSLAVGGGTTPSIGLYKTIRMALPNTPIMVMIRPRVGDFQYSKHEVRVMLEDISAFKAAKADGIVVGSLNKDGTIDVEVTTQLVCIPDHGFAADVQIDWLLRPNRCKVRSCHCVARHKCLKASQFAFIEQST
jgi:copper homeostasis protein CutC